MIPHRGLRPDHLEPGCATHWWHPMGGEVGLDLGLRRSGHGQLLPGSGHPGRDGDTGRERAQPHPLRRADRPLGIELLYERPHRWREERLVQQQIWSAGPLDLQHSGLQPLASSLCKVWGGGHQPRDLLGGDRSGASPAPLQAGTARGCESENDWERQVAQQVERYLHGLKRETCDEEKPWI